MDNYVMMNARREVSKQLSWQQDRRLLWLAAIFNYDNNNNNNNNNIRLICQDKPLDNNASYIYTSVSQDR